MNREALEQRKAELISGVTQLKARIASTEEVLEKLRADYLATGGALQECDYWLAQLPVAPLREVREETA